MQKISFATFGVSIDDFLTRYAGLGYNLIIITIAAMLHVFVRYLLYLLLLLCLYPGVNKELDLEKAARWYFCQVNFMLFV